MQQTKERKKSFVKMVTKNINIKKETFLFCNNTDALALMMKCERNHSYC